MNGGKDFSEWSKRDDLRQEARKTGEIVCAGMTREQMARYLGMNRSALSRLLGVMQREGCIELRRRSIRLLNGTISDGK